MTLRPQDLRNRRFRQAFRGASRWEVRELLGAAAADLDAALTDVERLRAELASAGARLVAARDQDREATRILSQAETVGRQLREEAGRQAAAATAAAEARVAAMLRELEAERELVAGRIAECLAHQHRLAGLLEGEVNDLQAFLASEPTFADEPATGLETACEEPSPLEAPPPGLADEDSTWTAADVARALAAAAPGWPTEEEEGEASGEDWTELAARTASPGEWSPGPGAEAANAGPLSGAGHRLRERLTAVGLGAAVIAIALASPGSRSSPPDTLAAGLRPPATDRPERPGAPEQKPAADALPSPKPVAPHVATEPPRPVPAGTLRVKIEAVRPCWIRLTANGRSEERVLQAGETLTRDSATDVIVRAGNAGALVVTVNGRTIPPLGREGEIVTRRLTDALAAQ